jgi:hypothetical protein
MCGAPKGRASIPHLPDACRRGESAQGSARTLASPFQVWPAAAHVDRSQFPLGHRVAAHAWPEQIPGFQRWYAVIDDWPTCPTSWVVTLQESSHCPWVLKTESRAVDVQFVARVTVGRGRTAHWPAVLCRHKRNPICAVTMAQAPRGRRERCLRFCHARRHGRPSHTYPTRPCPRAACTRRSKFFDQHGNDCTLAENRRPRCPCCSRPSRATACINGAVVGTVPGSKLSGGLLSLILLATAEGRRCGTQRVAAGNPFLRAMPFHSPRHFACAIGIVSSGGSPTK